MLHSFKEIPLFSFILISILSQFFSSTILSAQTQLKGINCNLEPEEIADSFKEPIIPVDNKNWEITNDFGNVVTRKDIPGLPKGFWQHTGVDYFLNSSSFESQGQTVYAAGVVVVVFSTKTKSNINPILKRGGLVIIRHLALIGKQYQIPEYKEVFQADKKTFTISYPAFENEEILTYYLHLDPKQISVFQGDQVILGQPIATLYNKKDVPKKFTYPPHLHFEVWKKCNTIEPNGYDQANLEFQESVTNLLIDPVSFLLTFSPQLKEPIISSSLKIIQSPPYRVGRTISAEFTITNKGENPITFEVLTVGGRVPNDQVVDFSWDRNITLGVNESYTYQGRLTLLKRGNYHFFTAYKPQGGEWNPAIPTETGITNTLDINVRPKGGGGEF